MKNSTKYALALTLVATTLCAGQLFAADQVTRTESKEATEKLVARITRSFSQTISRSPIVVQQRMTSPMVRSIVTICTDRDYCIALSPLESSLPPPLV